MLYRACILCDSINCIHVLLQYSTGAVSLDTDSVATLDTGLLVLQTDTGPAYKMVKGMVKASPAAGLSLVHESNLALAATC